MNQIFHNNPAKKFIYPYSVTTLWHKKKLTNFTNMLAVPMQIQAINPLIFRAQSMDVFLRDLYVLLNFH